MIKNKCRLAAVTIAFSLFTGAAQAAQLAVNGGFETGDFTGWTLFPGSLGSAGQEVSSINPSSGTFSGHLTEPAPAANIIKQANLAPGAWTAGQEVSISFDIRGSAANGGVLFAEFFTEISGGGTSSSVILGGGPLFPDGDPDVWTTYNFTAIVGPDSSGGITLQFNAACAPIDGCNADYFIDNVSIIADVNPVPVPAAVWLFGSGLIGLVGVARKKKAA